MLDDDRFMIWDDCVNIYVFIVWEKASSMVGNMLESLMLKLMVGS